MLGEGGRKRNPPPPAYIIGNIGIYIKYLTRLRLEFNHLKEKKFRHNFQDTLNPLCSWDLLESESLLAALPYLHNLAKNIFDTMLQGLNPLCRD